jgi:hypothetical protein
MTGGVVILLFVTFVLVVGSIALALYGTETVLWRRDDDRRR